MTQPVYRALFLVLGCICYRLISGAFPTALPNISPMIAVALVGAMYLPRAWGWLIGPVVLLVTDAAFLAMNERAVGHMFSSWTLISLAFYTLAGGLGLLMARRKSLPALAAGSIVSSLTFYVLANTFTWWSGAGTPESSSYTLNWAGWWQANTVGLPGWQPTWTFLRNGLLGDLFFCGVLVAIFDRELLQHPLRTPQKTVTA
jgi:hypothetical protein